VTSTLARPPADPPVLPAPSPRRRGLLQHVPLAILLVATGVLYLWDLAASGWANAFYSAAAQAGSQNLTAWFFGSSDAANAITVDKTPAALWVDVLSVRIFGLSSWSVLVPQALMGVAAVGLLYASVRRTVGPDGGRAAGLLAGLALAVTPVAALIFRFNNPDALLTLLLVAAAYATLRAVEAGRTRWLVLAGVFVGFGFLAKMLQAFLVVPALALVWLLVAPITVGKRIGGLLAGGLALVVSAGWWVLAADLWPAASRPYIGGSQTDSVLELVFGYNGFGRLTGNEVGSVGGVAGGGGGWGQTGLTRLFGSEMGGGIAWLLPAALILLVALLWWTRRAPRTDGLRAATIVWGGWLLVTGLTFSLMAGIIHPYYTVALAPAVAALAGIGAVVLWRDRREILARALLALTIAATVGMSVTLLRRASSWQPWIMWVVLATGAVAVVALCAVHRLPRLLALGVAASALVAGLLGPAAYSVATAATPHTGAIPSAGPASAMRGPGGFGGGPGGGGPGGGFGGGRANRGAPPGMASGGGQGPSAQGRQFGGFGGRGGGGMSGLLDAPTVGTQLAQLLATDGASYTWTAATVGSNNAAGYQLAGGYPVIALGGYNGTDPFPTLEAFQQLVGKGEIHWFIGGSGPGGTQSGGSDDARQIAEWVAAHYTAQTVDGTTVYDLTAS
jgi:4-amino-4-deoxy-L-arabinose transferase-like glycosyltransferase